MNRAGGVGLPAALLAGLLAVAGCSGASSTGLDAAAARALQDDVAAVGTAAAGHDYRQAQDALDTLRRDVAAARARGGLSAGRAQRILASQQRVAGDLLAILASRPPTPAASPSSPSASPASPAPASPASPPGSPAPDKGNGTSGNDQGGGSGGGAGGGHGGKQGDKHDKGGH